jgi:hypothetical protein
MRFKAEVGESNTGLIHLPLASFTESSGFSGLLLFWGGYWPVLTLSGLI